MLFARSPDGARREPTPGARAECPQCRREVLAKCGELVAWHWAHRAKECDAWSEGETDWHVGWKRSVEPAACEVVIGAHRADIRTPSGLVVELQHSAIVPQTIRDRESFYADMVWIFDARRFDLDLYPSAARVSFTWRRPKRSLLSVTKPMYWDLGHGFALRVESLSGDSPLPGFRGSGVLLDTTCLASSLFASAARSEVHEAALGRSQRVVQCIALAYEELRSQPSLGIDEALRIAMVR